MPQPNNKRENRYATTSNVAQLKAVAGMPNSNRTESRFAFARPKPLNPNAAPFTPEAPAPAASARRTRRHRKSRRATRRANRR